MNFLKKIFSPIILAISLLLLIYTFYQSEIIWKGQKQNYYFTYYVISSLLIFFSIITFFINKKIKEYLIISGISLIVSLYIFEGYFSFEKNPKIQLYERQTGKKWDKRTRLEVYKDLKKNNNVVLAFHPSSYIPENSKIFPLSNVSNSETIGCNENGYYSLFKSDRYGFNNPDDEWDKNQTQFLLVGDSFAQGACVNRPNDIASILRNLSDKSVLSLGLGGNGPLVEYATLREYLNPNIKKVLWIYFEGNDLVNLSSEKNYKILPNYLDNLNFSQNLKLRQNEIDDLIINFINKESKRENEILWEKFKIKFMKFIKITYVRTLIFPPPAPVVPMVEFKKILQLTKDLTIKNNSKLYFVYLPEYKRYKSIYDNANYDLVKNIMNELKIPIIDVHKEVFEKEENPLKLFPFELTGHYNIDGYKKVAKIIYELTKN